MAFGNIRTVACALALAGGFAFPVAAQQAKIGVIDVQQVLADSDRGKEAIQNLKRLQEQKVAQVTGLQQEVEELSEQYQKQQLALAPDKLQSLQKQIEDRTIALRRAQDDAQREFDDARRKSLEALENQIMPVITAVGKEQGFTLIFNKFQSGLVYADDAVDITDLVVQRFNAS